MRPGVGQHGHLEVVRMTKAHEPLVAVRRSVRRPVSKPLKKKFFFARLGARSHRAHWVGLRVAALMALMRAVEAMTRANCR